MKAAPLAAAVLLAALQMVVVGCRTPGPSPGPGQALAPDDPLPEALIRGLYRTHETRQGLRGQARFSLDAPDLKFRRPQRMALERPARVRVEVLALFGQVAGVLAIDGARYQFFDASTLEIQQGRVTPDLLWRVARIDLSAEQAVDILLGAPLPRASLTRGPAWRGPEGEIAIDFQDREGRTQQRFRFDEQGRLEELHSVDSVGEGTWTVEYGDYRPLAVGSFAHQIELRFPRVEAQSTFRFSAVELNPQLSDALFQLGVSD